MPACPVCALETEQTAWVGCPMKCSGCMDGGFCCGIVLNPNSDTYFSQCENYKRCQSYPFLTPFPAERAEDSHSHFSDPGNGSKVRLPCNGALVPVVIQVLKDCLLTNVEGQECDCGESGVTVSGVGVCMAGDDCRLSWADRLLVEDFTTAVPL